MSKRKIGPYYIENGRIFNDSKSMAWIQKQGKWFDFAGKSTCAAVTHLGDKLQPAPVKVVWKATLVAGIIMMVVSTYFSASSFFNMAGNSEMKFQNVGPFVEHPNYHICTSATFNQTILNDMGFDDSEMVSYLKVVTNLFTVSPTLVKDVQRQRQLETRFNKTLADRGIKDVKEIIQRALYKCEDIIAGCILPGIYVDGFECCSNLFSAGSFLAASGACVTTSGAQSVTQEVPSMAFGFVVFIRDLDDSTTLHNSIINPLMANQKRVTFSISDKWTHPNIALRISEHFARFGLWSSIAISKTIIDNEEVTYSILAREHCVHRNQQDEPYRHLVPGFDNYTENNCNYAIRQKRATQTMNCHVYTIPYAGDLPPCRPQQIINLARKSMGSKTVFGRPGFFSLDTEKCVSECRREMYAFTASYADLQLASNFKFGNWTISSNQSKYLAVLNFYYPTFVQTLLVNHYPTITQALGILGGNLGLFLGASMVTLIELFVFVFSCCC